MNVAHRRSSWAVLRAAAAAGLLAGMAGCESGPVGDGQIRVISDPPGATVICNGRVGEATPTTLTRLPPGTYLLVLEKAGYLPARKSVAILEGQRAAVDLKLEPATALALVHSSPPGADVHVDGVFRGKTPLFLTDLPLGRHRFKFEAAGRLPREIEEDFPDRVPRRVLVELPGNTGRILVRSTPPGAAVRLNGVERGATPCEIPDAPAGENVVEVLLAGYRLFTEKVSVSAQETREVAAVLQAIPTTLRIVSIPTGARIYVNNQFRGQAPIEITDLPPGEHRLRAELTGHEPSARTVNLAAQSNLVEEFRLQRNSGKIVIVSEPPGVRVFINGEDKGETRSAAGGGVMSEPFEVDLLPPGTYEVKLTRPGYAHTPRKVTLAANAVVDLHEKLVRRFVPDTRIRMKLETGEIVRDGMLIRKLPDGSVELQLDTGTIMKINAADILAIETLRTPTPR